MARSIHHHAAVLELQGKVSTAIHEVITAPEHLVAFFAGLPDDSNEDNESRDKVKKKCYDWLEEHDDENMHFLWAEHVRNPPSEDGFSHASLYRVRTAKGTNEGQGAVKSKIAQFNY